MRIALTRREYITHLDGVNRFTALLAESLAKLGHTLFYSKADCVVFTEVLEHCTTTHSPFW